MPLLAGSTPPWPPADDYVLDLSGLTFASPFDLVGLATLVLATPPEYEIGLTPPSDAGVANYLLRMDLLRLVESRVHVDPPFAPEQPRVGSPALIELRALAYPDQFDDESEDLWPRLLSRLPQAVCVALFEILGELVDNAATHGRSPCGTLIAAQYYSGATSGMPEGFWIGVADAGIGIRNHLRQNPAYAAKVPTDAAAIRLAVRRGVTGTVDRRGYGLPTALAEAGSLAPGRVTIRSGTGEATFYVGASCVETARYRVARPIPGTWVHVLAGHRDGPIDKMG